jgi:hypothetical protein
MKSKLSIAILLTWGSAMLQPDMGRAAVCANGVYNAGCAGPNGAVVVQKHPYAPPPVYVRPPAYHPSGSVTCANGPYRAGCAGPNGAAVVRKQY